MLEYFASYVVISGNEDILIEALEDNYDAFDIEILMESVQNVE